MLPWASIIGAVLLLAGTSGCKAKFYLPPGSVPAPEAKAYPQQALMQRVAGTWSIVGHLHGPANVNAIQDLIQRSGQRAGLKEWRQARFDNGELTLIQGMIRLTLRYELNQNSLRLRLPDQPTEWDDWQVSYANGTLFLRSLTDADTYTLVPASAVRAASGE